jgi:sugar diacid utilization regulator
MQLLPELAKKIIQQVQMVMHKELIVCDIHAVI